MILSYARVFGGPKYTSSIPENSVIAFTIQKLIHLAYIIGKKCGNRYLFTGRKPSGRLTPFHIERPPTPFSQPRKRAFKDFSQYAEPPNNAEQPRKKRKKSYAPVSSINALVQLANDSEPGEQHNPHILSPIHSPPPSPTPTEPGNILNVFKESREAFAVMLAQRLQPTSPTNRSAIPDTPRLRVCLSKLTKSTSASNTTNQKSPLRKRPSTPCPSMTGQNRKPIFTIPETPEAILFTPALTPKDFSPAESPALSPKVKRHKKPGDASPISFINRPIDSGRIASPKASPKPSPQRPAKKSRPLQDFNGTPEEARNSH